MAGWARELATTIADYGKGYEDDLMGQRVLLASLKKKGNIMYNCGGSANASDAGDFTWQVPYRQAGLQVDDFETSLSPVRQDRWQRAGLNYIGYSMTDQITKREKLRNKGPEQIIDVFKNMAKQLLNDGGQQFSKEFYTDSSASGNSGRLSGIETMMAYTQTMDITSITNAGRSANAADLVAYSNDTYAGLVTSVGNYGGSWNTDITSAAAFKTWPAGRGDMQFDFYTPIIVNVTSTSFSQATHDFANQCLEAARYLFAHNGRYTMTRKMNKILMLERDYYRQMLNKLDAKERFLADSQDGLRALGFADGFTIDGVDVTWEIDMPATTGYLWDVDNMQLRSCQDSLFYTDGPTWHDIQRSFVTILDFYGQLKFHAPRFFGKLYPVA